MEGEHMNIGKRIYWVAALLAVFVIAGAALTLTSRLTSAGSPAGSTAIEDGADDGETSAGAGQLDDGKDLLPQAGISIDAAIAAARGAASGAVGEIDLEHYNGKLVFNVDIGDHDVKVDASTGAVLAADQDD
jgi:uncharacterized membrane protein YkoI